MGQHEIRLKFPETVIKYIQDVYLLFSTQVPMRDFHATFDVVFVDPSGYLNLAAAVDIVSYQMVRHLWNRGIALVSLSGYTE